MNYRVEESIWSKHMQYLKLSIYKSSLSELFCKNSVLKIFTKLTGKHLCQSLFFNKDADATCANIYSMAWIQAIEKWTRVWPLWPFFTLGCYFPTGQDYNNGYLKHPIWRRSHESNGLPLQHFLRGIRPSVKKVFLNS